MSRAEKFIQDYTRNCSNLMYRDYIGGFDKTVYKPWLTPDDARKVAEIAREETINEVFNYIKDKYEDIGLQYIRGYEADVLIEDLKKHLENKL